MMFSGVGVGFTRDPATLMLGQYFKGKRAHVEIILVAGSGIGISFVSSLFQLGFRYGPVEIGICGRIAVAT